MKTNEFTEGSDVLVLLLLPSVEASAFFLLGAELHLFMTMSMSQCANLAKSLLSNFFLTTFSILINSAKTFYNFPNKLIPIKRI